MNARHHHTSSRMAACLPPRARPGPRLSGRWPRARATRVRSPTPRATPDDAVVTLISPAERDPPETRGVLLRDFVDAFERAERDAHSDLNPSGACDLTRAESRLLEGKENPLVGMRRHIWQYVPESQH